MSKLISKKDTLSNIITYYHDYDEFGFDNIEVTFNKDKLREFINSVPYISGAFEINDSLTISTCFYNEIFCGYVFNENYKHLI